MILVLTDINVETRGDIFLESCLALSCQLGGKQYFKRNSTHAAVGSTPNTTVRLVKLKPSYRA